METGANKILPRIDYSPRSTNNLLTEKHHLSLEIGLKNIKFCLFDTLSLKYILIKEFEFLSNGLDDSFNKIKDIISKEAILKKEFYSSSLTFNKFPSTLIPKPFYKEKSNKEILSLNFNVYEEILADEMECMDSVNIYSIPNQILNFICKNFPSIQIKCNSTIFIEQLLLQYNTDSATIYASIKNNMFEICVIENNKLEFHNFFSVETKEDILYFLLFTIEQIGLSAENTELVLFDDILEYDDKYNLLYQYIRNIRFGERQEKLKISEDLGRIEKHQFFTLFSQILCV